MAAVDATDCAIEGTVNDASREDGRPERCMTPEGDGVGAGGGLRVSVLIGAGGLAIALDLTGIVLLAAAALLATGALGLTCGDFALTAFLAVGFAAGFAVGFAAGFAAVLTALGAGAFFTGAFAGLVLAAGRAVFFAALAGVFAAVLALAGMAFTS